jgi:PKD repeat protein
MKTLKYLASLTLVLFIGCSEDDNDLSFIDNVVAPTNVSALFQVKQDNTGLVTITPNGEGAVSYNITFGDDTEEAVSIEQGENVEHTYAEGTYTVALEAIGITGLTSEVTLDLVVSFNAPENLVVTIENDAAISKQVNVTATADFAITYDVFFGEDGNDTPVSVNIGDTVNYTYMDAGTYTIRVVVMGAAIETTEYIVEFEVTAILQPLASAPMPPVRAPQDVISIFSAAYTDETGTDYFPDWGQGGQGSGWALFDLNGDEMLQYINLSYQGNQFAAPVDVTQMEFLHLDIWTADAVAKMETSLISVSNGEKPVWTDLTPNDWTSVDIPISSFTDQGLTVADIHQLKYVGDPWAAGTVFIDNVYFWKTPAPASGVEGIWVLAPEAGALGVGPAPGDTSWWNCDAACVTTRACYYDDSYIFGPDGSFYNVLGSESWIEGWQGGTDNCGIPVAPHDGSAAATYIYDDFAETITINGAGSYIGLPKAVNAGELPNVPVPSSITYDVTLSEDNNTMNIIIEAGSGVYWHYKLVRYTSPLAGTWVMAPEAGALGVGPALGDTSWWNCDAGCVTARDCFYDDTYTFGTDGSFSNDLGAESWIEGWQGGSDSCGTPVAPHDGSANAYYLVDDSLSTITIVGAGAYIGLPKAVNAGELPNVPVPNSITYQASLIDANTISVYIESGGGVFWQYKLVRQ